MIPARTQQNRNAFSLFWPTNDRVLGKNTRQKFLQEKNLHHFFRFRDSRFKIRLETF